MPANICCADCVYYKHKANDLAFGDCRRHAPRPDQSTPDTFWPIVSRDDWCGEFRTDARIYVSTPDGKEKN